MPRALRLLALLLALPLAACGDDAADVPATADVENPAASPADALDAGALPDARDLLGSPEDEAALAAYPLSMERLERWQRAAQNLQEVATANPALAATWEAQNTDAESLDEIVGRIEREPEARRAIESAGIAPRDYVLTSMALIQAMFAMAAVDMGQSEGVPDGVNPENVAFVREHRADIEAMMTAMQEAEPPAE